jgi:pyruvate kinase
MLSGESAAGKYPIESVTMQQLIINKVETDEVFRTSLDRFAEEIDHQPGSKHSITSAITIAARQVRDLN